MCAPYISSLQVTGLVSVTKTHRVTRKVRQITAGGTLEYISIILILSYIDINFLYLLMSISIYKYCVCCTEPRILNFCIIKSLHWAYTSKSALEVRYSKTAEYNGSSISILNIKKQMEFEQTRMYSFVCIILPMLGTNKSGTRPAVLGSKLWTQLSFT